MGKEISSASAGSRVTQSVAAGTPLARIASTESPDAKLVGEVSARGRLRYGMEATEFIHRNDWIFNTLRRKRDAPNAIWAAPSGTLRRAVDCG